MWTFEYTLSQIFVITAMILAATTYLVKNKKLILLLSCLFSLCYTLQYILLGAYTGAVLNTIGIIRGVTYFLIEQKGKKINLPCLLIFEFLFLTGGILTFRAWPDIIATSITLLYTFAVWQSNIKFYRWQAILCSFGWITYAISIKSIFAIVSELVMLTIEIIGVIKLYIKPKNNIETESSNELSIETKKEVE